MRIYIVNILPLTIKNKLEQLSLLFSESDKKIKYELCSKEFGIHMIEGQTISHIESTFKSDYELIKGYNKCDLLVDRNVYTKIPVLSQFPVNYICSKYTELSFKTNKKSKLSLVIECIEETQQFQVDVIPVNFYFKYESDILDLKDYFFQEEFNVFLSSLN